MTPKICDAYLYTKKHKICIKSDAWNKKKSIKIGHNQNDFPHVVIYEITIQYFYVR